jgi:hypothetical protein
VLESRLVPAPQRRNPLPADTSNILTKAAIPMTRDLRKTWQYFAQAVIQEEDPAKLTYLMQELYRVLKDGEKPPSLASR